MNWLYNTAIRIFAGAAKLAAIKSHKVSQMVRGQQESFDYLSSIFNSEDRPIWIHAASLGEFEQGRTLIEARGLPAWYSPKSAGYVVAHTIHSMISEGRVRV